MSATPIPYTVSVPCPGCGAAHQRRAADPGSIVLTASGSRLCGAARGALRAEPGHDTFRSALDIGRPSLLDQLDHRVRHRNVIEFLGHLAALGEGPFEELDG